MEGEKETRGDGRWREKRGSVEMWEKRGRGGTEGEAKEREGGERMECGEWPSRLSKSPRCVVRAKALGASRLRERREGRGMEREWKREWEWVWGRGGVRACVRAVYVKKGEGGGSGSRSEAGIGGKKREKARGIPGRLLPA